MPTSRAERLQELIDGVVSDILVDACVEKVQEKAVPMVDKYILETYGPLPKIIEIHDKGEVRKIVGVVHEMFETVLKLVTFDLPVYLSGEAGCGKNVICKQIAEALDLPFYFTNAVTQEYKLTGFIDANGKFHETQFYKAFKDGGVFFLDELDASIPEVLVILNAAIANRYFDFPTGKIEAHPNFRIIAAGNTFGTGADHVYSGRYCLDGASLDRFNTVLIPYSEAIERSVTNDDQELIDFCHEFRKCAKDSGNKAIFSYRGLGSIAKLKGNMPLEDVLKICLIKGMDKDDFHLMQQALKDRLPGNKYNQVFTTMSC